LALAAANRVLMLEHSVYSVISPEGCASIFVLKHLNELRAMSPELVYRDRQDKFLNMTRL